MKAVSNPRSIEAFARTRARSKELFDRARKVMPGGVSHNARWTRPFPLFIKEADGAYIWDEDGNRYLDFGLGSASLLLGHKHPKVMSALKEQLEHGSGATACTERELEWAEIVQRLVPSAERVRFTGSGTEATLLAMRLARAYTHRPKIVKFQGHFHGWHDYTMVAHREPFDQPASAGIPAGVLGETLVASIDEPIESLKVLLERDDVAGVILEPSGAGWGTVPVDDRFLREVRQLTADAGVVLIFDEMITGFRVAPGGSQAKFGLRPDLTTLGKILTGGLPGGAVAGKAEIMELLSPMEGARPDYVFHFGTFNASPLSAVAGVTTLDIVADGTPNKQADKYAADLRASVGALVDELEINGFVYGQSSWFHVFLAPHGQAAQSRTVSMPPHEYLRMPVDLIQRLHWEMRLCGVNLLTYNGGVTSAAHGAPELDLAVEAFESVLHTLRDDHVVATR